MVAKPRRVTRAALGVGDRIEWVIAAVSLVVVLGLMGFLAVQAFTQRDGHPALTVQVIDTHVVPGGTAVTIEVRNQGHATAAGVEIAAAAGADEPMAGATLGYVPADSWREVTLVFAGGVDAETLDLRVIGYSDP